MAVVSRGALVAVLTGGGLLVVVGCALALVFEVQGFGVPRDAEPRTWHVLGYATGALAGVLVPTVTACVLLPRGRRWVAGAGAVLAAAVVVALLGVTT
ncbi:hypothetical protein [uncultured Pseudokineococcus sp.]|uniref:hypothetical protein n=1 Tax=uncultured Pseudokineococcus sp. TaxID=1642928 RepID=UPI00262E4B1B|nr:hypothetical protein [uncultured Pseudokineococcus sp.]